MIVVDSREASAKNVRKYVPDISVETLEVGDYIIFGKEKNLIIERKSVQDLLASSFDRLWEQLKALSNAREQGYEPYVLIEGEYVYNPVVKKPTTLHVFFKTNPEKEKMFYSIVYAVSQFDVHILFSSNFEGTCNLLKYLDEKLGMGKEKRELPERRGFKKDWSVEKKREYLLEAFGLEFAKAFKNVTLKDLLESPLSREKVLEKLPKHFLSGRTIPFKKLEEFLDVIGYDKV